MIRMSLVSRSKEDSREGDLAASALKLVGDLEKRVTELAAPLPMLLFCPRCHKQHVDRPDGVWKNPPHATHKCHYCDLLWRPSNRFTVGVRSILPEEPGHLGKIFACDPRNHLLGRRKRPS